MFTLFVPVLCTVPLRLALSYYIIKKSAHLSYDGRKVVRITEARCKKEDTLYKDTRMSPFLKQKLRLKHVRVFKISNVFPIIDS